MLTHRTYVIIFIGVIKHIGRQERVIFKRYFHLFMEHVELYVRYESLSEHELIVLLTAVSGIGHDFRTVTAVLCIKRI